MIELEQGVPMNCSDARNWNKHCKTCDCMHFGTAFAFTASSNVRSQLPDIFNTQEQIMKVGK